MKKAVTITGGNGSAIGAQCKTTFTKAYGSAPRISLTPANANAGNPDLGSYVTAEADSWDFNLTGTTPLSSGQTYTYIAIE